MNAMTEPAHLMAAPDDEVVSLRIPPHSLEAEQSVLGGLLLENEAFDRVGDKLTAAAFYRRENRLIFDAIGALIAANKPADVVTVFDHLGGKDKAAEFGGLAYVNSLAESVPSAANIRRYAEIVAEKAARRALIVASDELATLAFRGDKPLAELVERGGALLAGLQRGETKRAPRALDGLLVEAIDRYSALAECDGPTGVATGIGPLDRMLHGLKRGKVYGVAARPSVGKSTVARAMALHAASKGYSVLMCSMEMPAEEVTDCLIAYAGSINSEKLQTGKLEQDDWGRLTEAVESLRGARLLIDDEGGLTLAALRAKARAVKGLDLLVVDYLQLMGSTLRGATTNDQVAEISKGLKALSLELGIPIVVLSQLSRKVEDRADKEPTLSDLRDSGAIEQDLDVAVMLWTVREEEGDPSRLVGWKVAKHRGGKRGSFGMRLQADVYQWRESAEEIRPIKPGGQVGKGGYK